MGRVQPVVRDWSYRVRHGRRTVRVSGRAERGLSRHAGIDLPPPRSAERALVVDGQFHDEIVRLLAVVDGVAVTDLACREVVQRAAAGHRPRLGAQHRAHTDTTAAKPSTGHEHAPVEAARLAGAEAARSVAVARFVEALHDHRPVESNVPAAPRAVHAVHRSGRWNPRRSRRLSRRRQHRAVDNDVLMDLRGRRGLRFLR